MENWEQTRDEMLRAYLLLRTRYGTSKEVLDGLRENHAQSFIQGSSLYGWYDAIIELKISNALELNEIVDELKHNYPDIIHIGTAVEKTEGSPSFLSYARTR